MERQAVSTHYYYAHHPHQQHYHDPALASLAYRPLQLPFEPLQQHAPPTELAPAAGFINPRHQQQQQQHHIPLRTTRQQARQHARTMAAYQGTTEEEYAELQKLSNEYEPEVTGPLVGQRQPSSAITTEYASADPVFQAKTAALPQKFSQYRTVRGDGRCGWRAVAFGYFETLVHLGDVNKFLEEEGRLRSLSNVLNAAGFDEMLYEDFANETFELLRRVAAAVHDGTAEEVLLEAFNDDDLQNYIITHLKTLTSAWMKTRSQEYAPWLLGQTVDDYCNASVMPIGSEIDHVGLSALKDVFLSPAGITLEVNYLDRSEGSEVTMHRFSPVNHGGFDIGIIRLLYRPGHYDLLYMPQDLPQLPVTTYLQYASQPHQEIYDLGVPGDFMTLIPGMSYANPHQGWMSSSSYGSSDFFATSGPVQQCTQAVPTPSVPIAPQPQQIRSQPVYVPATPIHLVPPPTAMPQELAIRTVPHSATMLTQQIMQPQSGPFRRSAWEDQPGLAQATSHVEFQTSIFRNSHFNTAHYRNPDFQPEEWHPDDEYVTISSKSSRHRNSG